MTDTTDPQTADEADVDTVASRAAQVITSMGTDIRALTGERDRYRSAWCSARERAQAYGEGILRVVKDRESYQEWLRQAEERAAVPAAPPAPADRAGLRERIADVLAEADGWRWAPGFKSESPTYLGYQRRADLVLSVLPPAADRAAVLREAATIVRSMDSDYALQEAAEHLDGLAVDADEADGPGRMADEEQQPETQAREETGAALARYIAEQPVSVVQAMFRILGWPLRFELAGDPTTPPAVVAEPGKEARPAIPCSWAATRYQHSPHDWNPQPGMDPVPCPGWSDGEPTP